MIDNGPTWGDLFRECEDHLESLEIIAREAACLFCAVQGVEPFEYVAAVDATADYLMMLMIGNGGDA